MEELGDELLDVAWVVQAAVPLLLDALEKPIWIVVFAALELDHPLWVLADEEADDIARATVVGPIEVPLFLGQLVVPTHEVGETFFVKSSYGL